MKGSRRNRRSIRSLLGSVGATRRREERARECDFERLEERKLLFTLTITPDVVNPATGLGQVTAHWAYVRPYITTDITIDAPDDPETVEEDFNDEAVGGIPQNFTFLQSEVRVIHNFAPTTNFRIAQMPGGEQDDLGIRVVAVGGQFWQFDLPNVGIFDTFSIDIVDPDGFGLVPSQFRVLASYYLADGTIATDVFTGNSLLALIQNPNQNERANGIGRLVLDNNLAGQDVNFARVRFETVGSGNMFLDNMEFVLPSSALAELIDERVVGVSATLTGPVGASVSFFDLYDRAMVRTLRLGIPPSSEFAIVDPDADGIPNFNDGIGRIVFSNTDSRTSFNMFGGEVTATEQPTPGSDLYEFPFEYFITDSIEGLYSDFESSSAPFGYTWYVEAGGGLNVEGLPPGPGSVIVGSPFVRNNASANTYNPLGPAAGNIVTTGFSRPDQGFFVLNGASIGSILLHGILHGSSQFTGAVERLAIGYLVGSINVAGDLGSLTAGTDTGMWAADPGYTPPFNINNFYKTNAELVVGRTVGEIAIAGRSVLDVTVLGDLSDPVNRPPHEILNYVEREHTFGIAADADPRTTIRAMLGSFVLTDAGDPFLLGNRQSAAFGLGTYRNDSIMSAEWIGSIGTAVRVLGELGFGDTINADDQVDVFAFASDAAQPVVLQVDAVDTDLLFRIVDEQQRTFVASRFTRSFEESQFLRFDPPAPGVYYLVVSGVGVAQATDDNTQTGFGYAATLTGLTPTTLGAYRTGGGNGNTGTIPNGLSNGVTVLNGNVGSFRFGTGYWPSANGGDIDATETFNPRGVSEDNPLSHNLASGTFSVKGTLFDVTVGRDVRGSVAAPVNFVIGGDFGQFHTGLNPAFGAQNDGLLGDVIFMDLRVAGRIAMLDFRGAVGYDQISETERTLFPLGANVITGTAGGDGSIGMIRVGSHVLGGTLLLTTPPGSTVGGMLVSQDIAFDPGAPEIGIWLGDNRGVVATTGSGSDVRFVDFPRIDVGNTLDSNVEIRGGQPLELVDDGGGRVRIEILGLPTGALGGIVRYLPVDVSQGVAIAQIDQVDLTGGRQLLITSTGNQGGGNALAPISIGRINIIGADGAAAIGIRGNVEVDVWSIVQSGGERLQAITNETPRGDIVAIDVVGVDTIDIRTGTLGRTQVPAWGPSLIGPFLGVQGGKNTAVGGPLGISQGSIDGDWAGGLHRPVTNVVNDAGTAFLDDIGGPFDGYLNGLVARTGDVLNVNVGGSIGDVILQDENATLVSVRPNFDRSVPAGEFEGIVGVLYATIIGDVSVGMGIRNTKHSPLATAGIFADDEIRLVTAEGAIHPGAFISAPIIARNSAPATVGPGNQLDAQGIGTIRLRGASMIDAHASAELLDGFWLSLIYVDPLLLTGTVNLVDGLDGNVFRSTIRADIINDVRLDNGFFDASILDAWTRIFRVQASGYRNSTTQGTELEFHPAEILSGGELDRLSTFGSAGDYSDIRIDVFGWINNEISGRNFTRVDLDVNNHIPRFRATGVIASSSFTAGRIEDLTAKAIRTSEITVSGPLQRVSVDDDIYNTAFAVTGPQGQIDTITARTLFSGRVSSSGPIGTIRVNEGDLAIHVATDTSRGTVGTLSASRDLRITADVRRSINTLTAGRHIGDRNKPGMIVVHGALPTVTAGGQLYTDIRAGETIGTVTLGLVPNRPGDDLLGSGSIYAAGRIGTVNVTGDFAGGVVSYSGGIGAVNIHGGSFLPTASVIAYDGHVDSVVVNAGNFYGRVHADWIVLSVQVLGTEDGVFGDMGVNPFRSAATPYDAFRNQLPPRLVQGTAIQGPTITAGWNIGNVLVDRGSVFEAMIKADYAIGFLTIGGDLRNDELTAATGSVIAAGDSIHAVSVGGSVMDAMIIAGVRDFGQDGRPGGRGIANRDSTQSGFVNVVNVGGAMVRSKIVAGIWHGPDGVYGSFDDRTEPGVSYVGEVNVVGDVFESMVVSEGIAPGATAGGRLGVLGPSLPINHPDAAGSLVGTPVPSGGSLDFATSLNSGTIFFSGPGSVSFDSATNRVILSGTTEGSAVVVTSTNGALTNFDVVTTNFSSIGLLRIEATLFGDSDVYIDHYAVRIELGNDEGTGDVTIGQHLDTLVVGHFRHGTISAKNAAFISVVGEFGDSDPDERGDALIDVFTTGFVTFGGTMRGHVNVDRVATSITLNAPMSSGVVRSGSAIGSFSAPSLSRSFVSSRDFLDAVSIAGNVTDSAIMVGGDLGRDAEVGGTGDAADRATTGFAGTVNIGGSMIRSSVVAGFTRGSDGYFGTSDDSLASGRSVLAGVSVVGAIEGSNRNSESYRVSSTGDLGAVTAGGAPARNNGNFQITNPRHTPLPIQVSSLAVTERSRVYSAVLTFNQPMDSSSFSAGLSVSEVRGTGEVEIRLVEGIDYTLNYVPQANQLEVIFDRSVTERDLPQLAGVPGPGVYRFELSSSHVRSSLSLAPLDGNGDGMVAPGERYSQDDIVGDPGDKLPGFAGTVFVPEPTTGVIRRIDFYPPVNLDIVLDDNHAPDGLPTPNRPFTLRGSIGDHPDHNTNLFRFPNDTDLYRITLQAGQILRLGAMQGSALFAGRFLVNPNGDVEGSFGPSDFVVPLPAPVGAETDATFGEAFLIKQTGVYHLMVANVLTYNTFGVPNISSAAGGVGDYNFTVEVFDDGNSGFSALTDAGSADPLVNAPAPITFAGADGVFGTADDLTTRVIGDFTFTISAGADGILGTADDFVTGSNAAGTVSAFTDTAGRQIVNVESAIGPRGSFGLPSNVVPDVDVYALNGGNPIAAGSRVRVTLKLNELGADLGSRHPVTFEDFSGGVQFGIFDITTSSDIDDGMLVFSPSRISPNGSTPGELARNGDFAYGYDANGDFFIDFVAPGRLDLTGQPARYAVYVQGIFNTDYRLEVVTEGASQISKRFQNVFIELNGGTIDWLQVGGLTTPLRPFDAAALGFTGKASNGQSVNDYVTTRLVANLSSIFSSAVADAGPDGVVGTSDDVVGLDVRFSTNPNAFEFQDYSTIFLTTTVDPITLLFSRTFDFFSESYGFSFGSDGFNSTRTDEGVVFLPSLALLGYTPSPDGLDGFVQSLTAAVGRRVGEMLGLRISGDYDPFGEQFDLMAANSVSDVPGSQGSYSLPATGRALSNAADTVLDTDFFLGRQNASLLLGRYVRPK
ncbi:MAG: hypothetical protein DYG93_02435 [Leptolyngbya sp. PLA2]|nr:hypothetical protein [Leptolyngbya sp. PL-A2]MCQ3940494.1 hypothetical protein [cyanobacterium CYA1]MCZ7633959.1 hypothetical protein [Phycisphaerales bacterium]MDL1904344.1 hypothetical protein [Synechococcales cyanobacterium CNB]GIK19576.1 MAG: hypothetical protein BroJett004_17400 [Planctomycetota bacterium]